MAVSGNLLGKIPVVDDVLSYHEQEIHLTTSLDEHCIEFGFQTDRNYYVDLRQSYLALELKFDEGCAYETYNSDDNQKEHQEEAKLEEAMEEVEEDPVPLNTHVYNFLKSIFSNVEVYINNQQLYNSNGLYAHTSYICNFFKGAISEYKGVFHCESYDFEEFYVDIMEAPLSEVFLQGEGKCLLDPMALCCMANWAKIKFFSTSEKLYPEMKARLFNQNPILFLHD